MKLLRVLFLSFLCSTLLTGCLLKRSKSHVEAEVKGDEKIVVDGAVLSEVQEAEQLMLQEGVVRFLPNTVLKDGKMVTEYTIDYTGGGILYNQQHNDMYTAIQYLGEMNTIIYELLADYPENQYELPGRDILIQKAVQVEQLLQALNMTISPI